jgi:hypothetical protein
MTADVENSQVFGIADSSLAMDLKGKSSASLRVA